MTHNLKFWQPVVPLIKEYNQMFKTFELTQSLIISLLLWKAARGTWFKLHWSDSLKVARWFGITNHKTNPLIFNFLPCLIYSSFGDICIVWLSHDFFFWFEFSKLAPSAPINEVYNIMNINLHWSPTLPLKLKSSDIREIGTI